MNPYREEPGAKAAERERPRCEWCRARAVPFFKPILIDPSMTWYCTDRLQEAFLTKKQHAYTGWQYWSVKGYSPLGEYGEPGQQDWCGNYRPSESTQLLRSIGLRKPTFK